MEMPESIYGQIQKMVESVLVRIIKNWKVPESKIATIPQNQNMSVSYEPGVTLLLLYEATGHPELPRVKLAQKTHIYA